jgi:serine/threonine protein kinase
VPNGSLESHIFSENSSSLNWDLPYQIALGTAKGLAYLHEGCQSCIVHYDIKPENIQLDTEFCAKITEFGMAKLLGRDFNSVLTTI